MTTPIASDLLPPACVLRVGITGHRADRLPYDVTLLRAGLAAVMGGLPGQIDHQSAAQI